MRDGDPGPHRAHRRVAAMGHQPPAGTSARCSLSAVVAVRVHILAAGRGVEGSLHIGPQQPPPRARLGIYALKKQFDLWQIAHNFLKNLRSSLRKEPNYFEGIVLVIGEVSLWGRVVVCQRGWRAEFAYPRRIFLVIPESWESESHLELHALARDFAAYGVPVEFKVVEVEVRMRPPRWDPLAPPHGAG